MQLGVFNACPLRIRRIGVGDYLGITDLILAVVQLLERDISRLVVEVWDTLELVKL